MATDNDIARKRGDTTPIVRQLWENKQSGLKLDVTGFLLRLTVNAKKVPVHGIDLPEFFVDHEVVGDAVDGLIRFLPSEDDMDLLAKKYFYEIQITDADGFITTYPTYDFVITQDLTV